MSKALIVPMSIVASDGTELSAPADIVLARVWAAHEVDLKDGPGAWEALPAVERMQHQGAALTELRRAATAG